MTRPISTNLGIFSRGGESGDIEITNDDESAPLTREHDVQAALILGESRAHELIGAHDHHHHVALPTLEGVHRRAVVHWLKTRVPGRLAYAADDLGVGLVRGDHLDIGRINVRLLDESPDVFEGDAALAARVVGPGLLVDRHSRTRAMDEHGWKVISQR